MALGDFFSNIFGGGQQQQQQPQSNSLNTLLGGGQDTLNPASRFARNFGQIIIDPRTGGLTVEGGKSGEEEAEKRRILQAKQFADRLKQEEADRSLRAKERSQDVSFRERKFEFTKEQAKIKLQRDQDTAMMSSILLGLGGGGGAGSNVVQPTAPIAPQSILGQPGTSGGF